MTFKEPLIFPLQLTQSFFFFFIEDYSQHNKITYSTIISKTNNYYYKLPTILLFTNSDTLFTILALMEKGKEN